jgi:phosphoribosylglycinamide formyltransferase 1
MKPRIAILASGGGTTAEAFIRAAHEGIVNAEVGMIIVSRSDAGIFDRIAALNEELGLNIPCRLVSRRSFPEAPGEVVGRGYQTVAEEAEILRLLTEGNFDLIALMGYMKRIGPTIIKAFGWVPEYTSMYQAKMLNTHPGLLPDTKGFYGEQIQAYVLDKGLPYGGQTVHLVSEDYDDGPIIAEHRVTVEPNDTSETLFARVQAAEKHYLPLDIDAFLTARLAYTKAQK